MSDAILSVWNLSVNKRQDWFILLFINKIAEVQIFNDVKQLPKDTNRSVRNGILIQVSDSTLQVLGL